MSFNSYFIISPLLGAVVGYSTNWIAIKMLFRPHEEKYVFGIKLPFTPGMMPKRRGLLAKKLGETVSRKLLTDETLIKSLCSEGFKKNIEAMLDSFLSNSLSVLRQQISEKTDRISDSLLGFIDSPFYDGEVKPIIMEIINNNIKGFAALFVSPDKVYASLMEQLTAYFADKNNYDATKNRLLSILDKAEDSDIQPHIEQAKAAVMLKYEDIIRENLPAFLEALDLAGIIEEKINSFQLQEAEDIVLSVVDKELKVITYLGGLLGFIIGLIPPLLQLLG